MSEAKKMKLVELHLGPIRTNCYLMIQTEKKEALIIDPGDGAATVAAKLTEEGVTPKAILLTTIGIISELYRSLGNMVVFRFMGAEDQKLGDADKNLFHRPFSESPVTLQADQLRRIKTSWSWQFSISGVPYTPGHTPGGLLLFSGGAGALLRGYFFLLAPWEERIFRGKQLRTGDFRASSSEELPAETEVYPGHENDTSIEQEGAGTPMRKEKTK